MANTNDAFSVSSPLDGIFPTLPFSGLALVLAVEDEGLKMGLGGVLYCAVIRAAPMLEMLKRKSKTSIECKG